MSTHTSLRSFSLISTICIFSRKISEADVIAIEIAFAKDGYVQMDDFKVFPRHVKIDERETSESGRRYVPHVVEPSFGSERLVYAVLEYSYTVVKDRVVMKIPRDLVPIQATILPLVNKDRLDEKARQIYKTLLQQKFDLEYDESGSIGRRYARADETGIPLAVTVEYQTMKDDTVTLRDRDTWTQRRFQVSEIAKILERYMSTKVSLQDL